MTHPRPESSPSKSSVDVAEQSSAAEKRSRGAASATHSQAQGAARRVQSGRRPVRGGPGRVRPTTALSRNRTWQRRAWDRLWRFAATGYAISLLLHTTLLILMAVVLLPGRPGQEAISTLMSQSDKGSTEFADIIDTTEPLAGLELEAIELPQFQAVPSTAETAEPLIPSDLMSRFAQNAGSGSGTGEGASGGVGLPRGANAVTKGSFTVWTVPEDPKPRQTYIIVIQIELPEHLRRYPRRDLSGRVIGTDGYTQPIPDRRRGYLPVKEHQTQLQVRVPGGDQLVKDTIEVESRILKEKQTLVIVF